MIEYRYKKDSYLHMQKITLLRLIGLTVTYGVNNGYHLSVSLAVGPFEPSIGIHLWKQVLL